ncbi:Cysteine-rich repeat secretory protein 55 [Apostasia shenzhenica]|uniref:Cysteine-rich repeat secretory protein 55 n=1 Tax=Apostasia shenzhenica TaxID=1088818 RepID=A0A2I0A4T7_9ASPA|nr:Cysteine-rich repeat secretory protein 55 [Apostasia shenzhenica]
MAFSNHFFLVALFLLLPMASSTANFIYQKCDKSFAGNDALTSNIKTVLSNLQAKASQTGFTTSTATGTPPDQVYGLFQCRGNAVSNCLDCVTAAAMKLSNECSSQSVAYIWYDLCFLRFSNVENFFGSMENGIGTIFNSQLNAPNPTAFATAVNNLMSQLVKNILNSGANLYATAVANVTGIEGLSSITGELQCTEDLKSSICNSCINWTISQMDACKTKRSCTVLHSSCTASFTS